MNRIFVCRLGVFFLALLWAWIGPAAVSGQPKLPYKSPLGLAVDKEGKYAYVALHTAGTVAVVDVAGGKLLKEWPVGKGPNNLVLSGGKLYVTCEHDDCVVILDAATGKQEAKFAVGQGPVGIARIDSDARIFVICRDEPVLLALDPQSNSKTIVKLPGVPNSLFTDRSANSVHLQVLSSSLGTAFITRIPIEKELKAQVSEKIHGVYNVHMSAGWRANLGPSYGISVDYLPHQSPRFNLAATQVSQGWVFSNSIRIVQSSKFDPLGPLNFFLSLDAPSQGRADPTALIATRFGGPILVSSAGTDALLMIHWAAVADGKAIFVDQFYGVINWEKVKQDLSETRLYTKATLQTGPNPRRMAVSDGGLTLVVANYLGDSLTVIDVFERKVDKTISLKGPPPDAARRGEILFNSARLTQFGQFTCASCHPNGGSDGLNWDLPRDGIGNPMNTRSLLGVKDTAPYGWHGTSATLADRVYGTLTTLHGYEPTTDEVADLVAYLETLPPPRPLPKKLLNQDKVARGKALFHGKAACAGCHAGPTFQDGKAHNIGTARPMDISPKFDTPSLRGVVYTAPYLHDGSAETLADIFTKRDPQHKHGKAHELKAAELGDLVEFLRSL